MTKIMAVTFAPILAVVMLAGISNEGPSQDAKSVALDADYASTIGPQQAKQRTLEVSRTSRDIERIAIIEQRRRERAKARAEAQAERKAERQEAHAEWHAEQEAEAEAAASAATRESSGGASSQSGSGNLPELLLFIRSNESGGNYSAYNGSGCEGYGCGGAYQMHAKYASTWAASAGYPGLSSNAANWPASTQDAVALWLFYSTNPDGAHWCDWTDYC